MRKIFIALVSLIVFIILFFFAFLYLNNKPVSSDDNSKVFTIKSGEGLKQIAQKLEDNKFIKNKYVFLFYSYKLSLNKKIQAGNFKISSSFTTKEIIAKLSSGGVTDYWLKIIDGSRIEEVANLFPKGLSFTNQDFLTKVKTKEGYLFPDSYLIPQYFTIDQILATIETNFDQKFAQAKENSTSTLSDQKNLILASLLEREGRSLESKKMIAGILLNRLEIGMALQLDATVQYARDSQSKNITKYWEPITKSDISLVSPYNTYKNPGLPPKPICSPGYNSLYAVFHPTASDYLYYITGDDGKMHYATTLDEHNSNVAKYLR